MPASIDETASAMESKHSHQVVDTEHHDRLATPAAEHKPHTDSGAGLDTGLDFMLQHAEPAHTNTVTEHVPVSPPVVAAPDPLEFDLSGISLDLAPTGAHSAPVAHPASYPVPDHTAGVEQESHDTLVLDDDLMSSAPEMATKLDLAMAYEEIGDKEGARELLDEVIKGGSGEQVQKAKEMLSKLG